MQLLSALLVFLGFILATIEPPQLANRPYQPAASIKTSTAAKLDKTSTVDSTVIQTRAQARRQRSARIDFTMPYYRFGKFPAQIKD